MLLSTGPCIRISGSGSEKKVICSDSVRQAISESWINWFIRYSLKWTVKWSQSTAREGIKGYGLKFWDGYQLQQTTGKRSEATMAKTKTWW